ncbi:hypothetical protein AYR62_01685 [Secundilactobacillus paracollinoides]|uniref:SnoaL-like domain-containing protein n=1 Tax=Secundilactobacillus paracollinoides TaxID=240427 RepID=A0A1B2IV44_9LACO|nr:hypothetical protein [Secundilactobacillus paracollinoides]ANZ60107.1 hypothetical protein AYR61_01240 [Secundilactobacillus paracollinoides]ANZ62938.1 hypothetical protein AYR62_01685 [Secundilactobacillus paracollinoides]ANZ65901.1 hypothetical protein AYR63_01260 [Secundilactobacillus paracollinoides]
MTQDTAEISELVARERLFRARGNDAIADCYYPDAIIQTSWQSGQLDTFIHSESKEVDHRFPIIGATSPATIHQNGNKAYVEVPTNTRMRMVINGVVGEIESFRRLIDYVENRNGEWKIARMISINESDNLRPVVPGTDLGITPDDLKDFRPSYQFLSYVRIAAGGSISQDLLGTDRPEDVAKLYGDAEAWLAEPLMPAK